MNEAFAIKTNSSKEMKFHIENVCMFIMYITAFVVISNNSLSIITGPILVCMMLILFNTEKYYCIVALVLIANDSLGTAAFGFGSFCWIMCGLVIFRLIINNHSKILKIRYIFHYIIIMIFVIQLYVSSNIDFREILFIMAFGISVLLTINDIHEDREKLYNFFFHIAISIFIISANTVIFGGVVFHEGSARLGIKGIGIGDPNFSCLILNTGIAILLSQNHRNFFIRVGMILTMIFAMVQTVSITGLLGLSLLVILKISLGFKIGKAVRTLLIGIILITIAVQIYMSLPLSKKNESMELYIIRVEEKLNALQNKNFAYVTTDRSTLSETNLIYFNQQPLLNQLFGGAFKPMTRVRLSHNTYIDLLLRFGIIGTGIIGLFLIKFLANSFIMYYKEKKDGGVFLLKVVFLFFSSGLSIYYGNIFVLWYVVLFII